MHQFKLFGSWLYRIHDTRSLRSSLPDGPQSSLLARQQAPTLLEPISSGA
ncbi:hypothetical protein ABH943_004726 [Caballeronia udeis]|uniref:Uncharacterized protein n=1 Tax=Caballeronia udeis TaxID=1232866 RepID=A0ABW8MMV3_9BURK